MVGGGPRSRSWDCGKCKRTLSSELSGTVLDSHSGDNGQSKVWAKDEGAFGGEGRLSRDNEELRSSSSSASSGMGDSSMSIGGRDCVEVSSVGGGDMGASQIMEAFFIMKVESRTGLEQRCVPESDVEQKFGRGIFRFGSELVSGGDGGKWKGFEK
jgi:hypothetical protein